MIRDLSGAECIGYCRVSTERQAGETATSLDDQRAAITALAARLGLTVGEWFVDGGASGGTMQGRPEMAALLASCEAHARPAKRSGSVLALNASRWGRFDDPEEAPYWRFHLSRLGWVVRFAENDDSDNLETRHLTRAIHDVQASAYRKQIKANARRGARGTANQGFWRGRAPFGYRRAVVEPAERARTLENGVPKAPDEKVRLVIHEPEAAIVRTMFTTYATGEHSLSTLSAYLPTAVPEGSEREWCTSVVGTMLRNPAYCGDVLGGRRPSCKKGQYEKNRPRAEWYGKSDAHPAIIDRDLFAAVQARLTRNAQLRTGTRSDYVLTGLVHCETCGLPLVGGGLGGRRIRKLNGGRFHFYRCSSVNRPGTAGSCPGKLTTVAQHNLERVVIGTLAREFSRPAVQRAIVQAIDDELAQGTEGQSDSVQRVERLLAAAVKRRDRLVTAVANGTLTDHEAGNQIQAARDEISRLETIRDRSRFEIARQAGAQGQRDALIRVALDFPNVAKRLTGVALREVIRPWLAAATFNKDSRFVTLVIRRVPVFGDASLLSSDFPARGSR